MGTYKQAVVDYYHEHPTAGPSEVARALGISKSTVSRYRPEEYKPKPLTEEELLAVVENWERSKRALAQLDWATIKNVWAANGYRLYPINWTDVEAFYLKRDTPMPFDFRSAEEFETLLKEVFDSLYDWHLYEPCPQCGKGIRVPRWSSWTPFCGCSEFPACDFSMDREGKPIGA